MAKTTFRVRAKQWEYFNHECKVMSLRRDDLINRVLPAEIAILATVPPCDAVGSRWVKDRWITMWSAGDVQMVSAPVMLSDDVLQGLNHTCTEKNLPRDAFFDCFLEFLTGRLIDPALVIKDPRTERDLGSQVVSVMNDDDFDDEEVKRQLLDTATTWMKGRKTAFWDKSLYLVRLGYNAEKVEKERLMLEVFSEEVQKSK